MKVTQHPDDAAVDKFAAAMKAKMAASRAKGRGGWDDPAQCRVEKLATMLVQHVEKGDPVDIANFAMMVHQRGGTAIDVYEALAVYLDTAPPAAVPAPDVAQYAEPTACITPRITVPEIEAFNRFCECAEDFDSGGHDVDKEMMTRLTRIDLVRSIGFGRHETTDFGTAVRAGEAAAPAQAVDALPWPEMLRLADIPSARDTPPDWDDDYKHTWQKLQVAAANLAVLRGYARKLRAALGGQPVQVTYAPIIKTWRERLDEQYGASAYLINPQPFINAEIADLRAALAAKPAAPVEVPEAAQQNGGLVRAALIDLMTTESVALNGAATLEQQNDFRAKFTRGRAALAAPAGEPVAEVVDRDGELVIVWTIEDPDGYPAGTTLHAAPLPQQAATAAECPVCAGTHVTFGKRCACAAQGGSEP